MARAPTKTVLDSVNQAAANALPLRSRINGDVLEPEPVRPVQHHGIAAHRPAAVHRDKHRVIRQMRAIIGEHGARLLPHSSHINAVSGV